LDLQYTHEILEILCKRYIFVIMKPPWLRQTQLSEAISRTKWVNRMNKNMEVPSDHWKLNFVRMKPPCTIAHNKDMNKHGGSMPICPLRN